MVDCKIVKHPNGLRSISGLIPTNDALIHVICNVPRSMRNKMDAVHLKIISVRLTHYNCLDVYIDNKRRENPIYG